MDRRCHAAGGPVVARAPGSMEFEEHPDAAWVASLTSASLRVAHRLLRDAARETALFRHLVREHTAEGRPSYIEIDAPFELYAMVRKIRPRHVVEVGVSSGVSSAYLLQALERNGVGTLHSVDLPKRPPATPRPSRYGSWSLPPGRESGWAVPFRLRRRWDLRLGDKAGVLPLLAEELPEIDLFVYDVPHEDTATYREFRTLDRRMPAGAVAIADHGPTGGLCSALRRWGRDREAGPVRREGLGLYGIRLGRRRRPGTRPSASGRHSH